MAVNSKYPEELRSYVWDEYQAGKKTQQIYAEVMEAWPDCGMKSFRSICMMLGPLKMERGELASGPRRYHRAGA